MCDCIFHCYRIYLTCALATKFFSSQTSPSTAVPTTQPGQPTDKVAVNPWHLPPVQAFSEWHLGQALDMHVYLSTSQSNDVFIQSKSKADKDLPRFVWENITFGDFNEARVVELDVKFPEVKSTPSVSGFRLIL